MSHKTPTKSFTWIDLSEAILLIRKSICVWVDLVDGRSYGMGVYPGKIHGEVFNEDLPFMTLELGFETLFFMQKNNRQVYVDRYRMHLVDGNKKTSSFNCYNPHNS